MKLNVMIARYPALIPGGGEHPATTDWLVQTVARMKQDERIGRIAHIKLNDTPITMSRNRTMHALKETGSDLCLMVDSDMHPDKYLGVDPKAAPFWDTALNFYWKEAGGPCMIAAPYCGPPPHENIYIFRWRNRQSDHSNVDFSLEQFTREEAAEREGIEEVAALPTGLAILDTRALEALKEPYFYYEWKGAGPPCPHCGNPSPSGPQMEKASTEDVAFTRDLSLAGIPVFCVWNSWAGHYKVKCVGKPVIVTPKMISDKFRHALAREEMRKQEKHKRRPAVEGIQNGNSDNQLITTGDDSPAVLANA
jgi:hypothetical protein